MHAGWRAAILVSIALTACSGGSTASTGGALGGPPRGGTLRVVDFLGKAGEPDAANLDPVLNYDAGVFELFRCCLARTLLSYTGQPTDKGGADLKPDLATGMPDVSLDGLTWTFHVRSGIHYAPPLQRTEIAAPDFVRSLERVARLGPDDVSFYSVIRGYDAFVGGKTSSIAGLETPDAHTLVVRLTEPAGDLGYRFAGPFAFPLPALSGDPTTLYGVASGHDAGDGGFLVSSGPYMVEGSEALDFSRPPAQQRPAAGLVPGKSLTLVRNPSWRPADDPLRPAYVDRIAVTWATTEDAAAAVDRGNADLVLPGPANALPPIEQIHAYQADSHKGRVDVQLKDALMYLTMNLAVPPFDNVHVRRAVAYAVDRQAAVDANGGTLRGSLTGHVAADSMEDNALLTFDPYRTKDGAARIAAAKAEMALSPYDADHDGICDGPVCQHIGALGDAGPNDTRRGALEATIPPALSSVGLMVDMRRVKPSDFFNQFGDPTSKTAMGAGYIVGMAYPSGAYVFTQQFAAGAIGNLANYSLVGATPDQLRSWGYSVTTVPTVEDRIAQCTPLIGAAATHCWTVLDQYVVENVVAEVPLIAVNDVEVIPSRVVSYSYDQSQDEPALDRVAVQH